VQDPAVLSVLPMSYVISFLPQLFGPSSICESRREPIDSIEPGYSAMPRFLSKPIGMSQAQWESMAGPGACQVGAPRGRADRSQRPKPSVAAHRLVGRGHGQPDADGDSLDDVPEPAAPSLRGGLPCFPTWMPADDTDQSGAEPPALPSAASQGLPPSGAAPGVGSDQEFEALCREIFEPGLSPPAKKKQRSFPMAPPKAKPAEPKHEPDEPLPPTFED
jgi:hypothetical protein